ncbi:hypothetical protein BC628DRAFT_734477 [Trametes gibbosa]|nr:hypothetical protein BC628DRAFT_734477 [Trametes gibbosa]
MNTRHLRSPVLRQTGRWDETRGHCGGCLASVCPPAADSGVCLCLGGGKPEWERETKRGRIQRLWRPPESCRREKRREAAAFAQSPLTSCAPFPAPAPRQPLPVPSHPIPCPAQHTSSTQRGRRTHDTLRLRGAGCDRECECDRRDVDADA